MFWNKVSYVNSIYNLLQEEIFVLFHICIKLIMNKVRFLLVEVQLVINNVFLNLVRNILCDYKHFLRLLRELLEGRLFRSLFSFNRFFVF